MIVCLRVLLYCHHHQLDGARLYQLVRVGVQVRNEADGKWRMCQVVCVVVIGLAVVGVVAA